MREDGNCGVYVFILGMVRLGIFEKSITDLNAHMVGTMLAIRKELSKYMNTNGPKHW